VTLQASVCREIGLGDRESCRRVLLSAGTGELEACLVVFESSTNGDRCFLM
jgi:hypothetical protein